MPDKELLHFTHVIPAQFDDSLSYYEVLAKICNIINDLSNRVTELEQKVNNLQ